MLKDDPLDGDSNGDNLSGCEPETLLQSLEIALSIPVPAETRRKRKMSR